MKTSKFLVIGAFAVTSAISFAALAEYTGSPTTGQIVFEGELVNAACGLAPSSSPVQINFGQITVHALADQKHAGNAQGNIELQGCDLTVAKTAQVTYTPSTLNPNDNTLAAMTSGTATGAGIGLNDNGNQPVKWGEKSTAVNLVEGKTMIPFVAYLKADNASNIVQPGAFQSSINFQIDYQ